MKRAALGIIVIGVMFALCVMFALRVYLQPKHHDRFKVKTNIEIENILLEVNLDDTCVVVSSDKYNFIGPSIGKNLIVLPDIVGRAYSNQYFKRRYLYNKFDTNVYEIATKKLIKKYTLKEIRPFLEEQSKKDGMSYELHSVGGDKMIESNNNNYIQIPLDYDWSEDKRFVNFGYLYININTDEMKIMDTSLESKFVENEKDKQYKAVDYLYNEYMWKSLENSILINNGFSYVIPFDYYIDKSQKIFSLQYKGSMKERERGVVELIVSTNALPGHNQALYKKFPGLKEWQGQEGNMAIFHLSGYPTPEEILRLFVEDDKGVSFENCILSAKYSKDGKEHKIGSFEELDKWYQSTVARDSEHEAGEESETKAESSV